MHLSAVLIRSNPRAGEVLTGSRSKGDLELEVDKEAAKQSRLALFTPKQEPEGCPEETDNTKISTVTVTPRLSPGLLRS